MINRWAIRLLLGVFFPVLAFGGGSPTLVQEHYRWRNDDGSEAAATWKANADTAITGVTRGTNIRLRFDIANTSTSYSGALAAALEYSTSTSGPWTPVATNSAAAAAFEMTGSSGYANGDATTALQTGSGTFVAGKCVEAPSNSCASVSLGVSQYSNFEHCFKATAKAQGSTTYYFRLSNGGAVLNTYSQYAPLTMAAGEANEAPVIVSPLTAQTSTQMAMSYQVLASGSEPITYSANNVPAGITFDGTNRLTGRATSSGIYSVGLIASNSWGVDSKTLALTVLANIAPVASNQSVTARTGGETSFYLAWSDADTPSRTDHTFTILSQPSHGMLQSYNARNATTLYPDMYYYKADSGYAGSDSFTWKCSDGDKESNVGTVSVMVSNTPPTATSASLTITGGVRCALSFSYSDSDGTGQPLSMTVLSAPAHGILETTAWTPVMAGSAFPAANTLLFTPDAGYTGTVSFTWRVNDGLANSATATHTVNVTNFLLWVSNLAIACKKDTSLAIPILPASASGYTLAKNTNPLHGTVAVTGNHSIVYAPTNGYIGSDSFQYKVTGGGQTRTATISVTVLENGDWPQWRHDEYRKGIGAADLSGNLYLQWRRDLPAATAAWASYGWLDFDTSYRPVTLGRTLFVALNADDSVAAYDTQTGEQKWRFFTGGPVRCPPAAFNRAGGAPAVCFGSDDGYVYCLDGNTGSLLWKFRAGPSERKIVANGRVSSVWPVRGGVIYHEGKVFFAAGIWKFEGVFAHGLNAETGAVVWSNDEASGHYESIDGWGGNHQPMTQVGYNPQGSLAMSFDNLKIFAPAGRHPAMSLNAATGRLAGWAGGLGWYVDGSGSAAMSEPATITAGGQVFDAAKVTGLGVSGTVGNIMAGDDRLFVTTTQGSIYCFGSAVVANPTIYLAPNAGLTNVTDSWTASVQSMLSRADLKQGLGLVWGVGSGRLVEELLKQAPGLRVVAADPDLAKLQALKEKLAVAGNAHAARVSVIAGNPMGCGFAPYQAGIIASEDATVAGIGAGQSFAELLYRCTRPFGGEVWLPTTAGQHALYAGWVTAAGLEYCEVVRNGGFTQMKRTGLPDEDLALKPPYALLWTGNSAGNTPIRGRVGSMDLYTSLTLSADTPGYEPTAPTPNNAIGNVNLASFAATNVLYGYPQTRTPIWGYGCDEGRDYGKLHLERSNGMGVYERTTDMGTIEFNDIRTACSSSSIYAGNGVIMGGGQACGGCRYALANSCPALVSMPDAENWFWYQGMRNGSNLDEKPIKRLGVNFGAPGDRHVREDGILWVHNPRPAMTGLSPEIPVIYFGNTERRYHHSSRMVKPDAGQPDRRWVAASCVKGMDRISIRLAWPIVGLPASAAPTIDGQLNDSCWDGKEPLYLPSDQNRQIFLRYDSQKLYIGAQHPYCTTQPYIRIMLNSRDRDYSAGASGHIMVGCGYNGAVSSGISTSQWTSAWTAVSGQPFALEMAIPWVALENAGIWKDQLIMNVNFSGYVLNGSFGDQGYYQTVSPSYSPVYLGAARGLGAMPKLHNVRLYFAETEGANAGERVFDVKMQGQTVLANFDVAAAAGGQNRQVFRDFADVSIKDNLDLEFVPKIGVPIVSGAEIVGTYTTLTPNVMPTAMAQASVLSGPAPLAVTLSAWGSSDPDGQIVDCRWDCGDGTLMKGSKITHVFTEPGTYKVSTVVLDDRGGTGAASLTVTVGAGVPAAFVSKIRSSGGDYTNLATWAAAIQSDLTSKTTLFTVSDIGGYTNSSDNGKSVAFPGGGRGTLRWIDTNAAPLIAVVWNCTGTIQAGVVTNASGHTFTVSDAGTPTESLLFTVSARGNYDPAADDGKEVTFAGGGKGTLRHINTANVAYITECRGASGTGTVICNGGHTFTVAGAGSRIFTAVAEGYNDWPASGQSGGVSLTAGWVADEDHCVTIRSAAGHVHTGKLKNSSNQYTGFAVNGGIDTSSLRYTRLYGIILCGGDIATGEWGSVNRLVSSRNMVLRGGNVTFANTVLAGGTFVYNAHGAAFYNCTGMFDYNGAGTTWYVNCLGRSGFNWRTSAPQPQLSHCTSQDATACAWDVFGGINEGNATNRLYSFVNAASNDLHLAATDTGARGLGSPGLGPDVDGEERFAPYDIGADEAPDTAIAPAITSSLAAPAEVGKAFSYTITASGSQPVTFGASGLPSGLSLSGAVISGTPVAAGTNNVTLTASNSVGIDTRTLVLTVSAGVDAYGIPNSWKIQYFGSTNAIGSGALDDPDHDGMNNYQEYRAGTNPNDPASRFQVSGFRCQEGGTSGTNLVISWQTITGKFYAIQKSTNLMNGFTMSLQTGIPGTGGMNSRTVTVSQATEYFRIKVE
ncbi:MAG: hypothetical protein C0404_11785 [Verrucomicrobia bacterium]|nr:hypothetical protein [Verrucomicrobiota bacterium]